MTRLPAAPLPFIMGLMFDVSPKSFKLLAEVLKMELVTLVENLPVETLSLDTNEGLESEELAPFCLR